MDELMAPPTGQTGVVGHRGSMMLTFGILSIVLSGCMCIGLIFGILGWRWSGTDLRLMDQGTMDREGRSLTSAGRVCSIIGVVMGCLSAVYWLFWLALIVIGVATGAAAQP